MPQESDPGNGSGKREGSGNQWVRWALGGVSPVVLLTALLYLQGRTYRNGYLRALGLQESQFPMDTPQTLWLAFNGWLSGSVRVFEGFDSELFCRLVKQGLLTLLLVVLVVTVGLLLQRFVVEPNRRRIQKYSDWQSFFREKPILALYGFSVSAPLVGYAVVFLTMFAGAFLVLFFFILVCLPFDALGRREARQACDGARTTVSLVRLPDTPATLVLLECSSQFCALIRRSGDLLVVAADDVKRVDVLPVRAARPGEDPLPRCKTRP